MYYLNEDGKRVYTLKVRLFRPLAFDRSSLSLSLSLSLVYSFTRSCFRCFINKISRIELRSLTQFSSLFSLRRPPSTHKLNSENRSGWEADAFRAPGEILPGR